MLANESVLNLNGTFGINLALALNDMRVTMRSVMHRMAGRCGTMRSSREGGSGDQACA
jgi:hypothetical protein